MISSNNNFINGTPKAKPQSVMVAKASNLPFTVRDYSFQEFIGKGGFAEVYLVVKENYPNVKFVAKVMTVDPAEMEHKYEVFDAEIQALLALDHPHIIHLYDHFKSGNQYYLILEYCPNGSLHDEIARTNGLSPERFIKISSELVHAFAYCHSKNIAHRDIKPENILLDSLRRSKIADFGLSLRTQNGQLLRTFGGSFMYTAPEIFQKKAHDPKSGDIWALGVCFTIMATGSPPFQCDSLGGLKQTVASGTIHFKKAIPNALETIIRKMIVVDPSQRITMDELNRDPFFNHPIIYRSIRTISADSILWGKIPRQVLITEADYPTDEFELPLNENSTQISDTPIRSVNTVLMQPPSRPRVIERQKRKIIPNETFKGFEDEIRIISI